MEVESSEGAVQQSSSLTQENDDLKRKNEQLEKYIAELEESLESSLVEKEGYISQYEEAKQLLVDLEIQMQLKFVEKELECENLKNLSSQNSFLQSKLVEKEQLYEQELKQKEEFRAAFEQLSQWHLEKQTQLLEVEGVLQKSRSDYLNAMQMVATFQASLESNSEVIGMYKELTSSTDRLLIEHNENDKLLHSKLDKAQTELNNYRVASEAFLVEIKERESTLLKKVEELQKANENLMELAHIPKHSSKHCISPYESPLLEYSSSARLSIGVLSMKLHYYELQATLANVDSEESSKNIIQKEIAVILCILRCYDKISLLYGYFDCEQFQSVFEKYKGESQSTQGMRGFFRWLSNAAILILSLSSLLYCLISGIRSFSKPAFDAFKTMDGPLHKCVTKGEKMIDKLIECCQLDNLSSAVDLSPLEEFLKDLTILRNEMDLPPTISSKSLLLCDLRNKVHHVQILSLMGICKASYTPGICDTVPHSLWISLYQQCDEVLQMFPKENFVINIFNDNNTGFLYLENKDLEVASFLQSIGLLESVLCGTEETLSSIQSESVIGSAVKALKNDFLCIASSLQTKMLSYTDISAAPPWQDTFECEAKKFEKQRELEEKLQAYLEELSGVKSQNSSLTASIEKVSEEVALWKSKYSKERIIAEKCLSYEIDNLRLNEEKKAFVTLLNTLRAEKEKLLYDYEEKSKENLELAKSFSEIKRKLELRKQGATRQSQNEFYAREAVNLKQIIQNLQQELCEIQCEQMKAELEAGDMQYSDPLVFMEESFQTQNMGSDFLRRYIPSDVDSTKNLRFKSDFPHVPSVNQIFKFCSEYRALQHEILLHNCDAPIWDPCISPLENETRLQQYRSDHDAIQKKIFTLEKEIDIYISTASESGALSHTFGEHGNAYAFRYMKKFADLAGIDAHKVSAQPIARILIPLKSIEAAKNVPKPQRILVTDEQLSEIHRKLVGS